MCAALPVLLGGCGGSVAGRTAGTPEGGLESMAALVGEWCVEGIVVATNGTEAAASGWAGVEWAAGGAAQLETLELRRQDATVELLMLRTWDRTRGVYRFGLVRGSTADLDVLEGHRFGERWEVNSLPFDDFVQIDSRTVHTSLVLTRPDDDRYRIEFFGSADAGGTWARGTRLDYTRDTTGRCRPPAAAEKDESGDQRPG